MLGGSIRRVTLKAGRQNNLSRNQHSSTNEPKPSTSAKSRKYNFESQESRRAILVEAETKLGITSPEGWYQVTPRSLANACPKAATFVATQHANSITSAALEAYPTHKWIPWYFYRVPTGFWNSKLNRRAYFDDLGQKLGFSKPEDWYKLTRQMVTDNRGSGLLHQIYKGHILDAIKDVFPDHKWQGWLFQGTVHSFWKSIDNQRDYMDWLATELNIKKPEDWYNVGAPQTWAKGARFLLSTHYQGTLGNALAALFPSHNWQMWRFHKCPEGFWTSWDNRKAFFDWVGEQLNLQDKYEWYLVDAEEVRSRGGSTVLQNYYYGSLHAALSDVYPDIAWSKPHFRRPSSVRKEQEIKH